MVRRILVEWGEHRARMERAAYPDRSSIIRIGQGSPGTNPSDMGLHIPECSREASGMGRALADMRASNAQRYRSIELRYAASFDGRIGHERDDRLRAAIMGMSVAAYRMLLTRAVDGLASVWRSGL